jgi:hypothetical protein
MNPQNGKGSTRRPENNERMNRAMDIYIENCKRERNGQRIMTRDEEIDFLTPRINHAGTSALELEEVAESEE